MLTIGADGKYFLQRAYLCKTYKYNRLNYNGYLKCIVAYILNDEMHFNCWCKPVRSYLWGLSLGTGSRGRPCCQPSGLLARSGARSTGPYQTDYTYEAPRKDTNRRWTPAKHLEGFQFNIYSNISCQQAGKLHFQWNGGIAADNGYPTS